MGARIAAINLFEVDLDKPKNYLWFFYERYLRPGSNTRHFIALWRPWNYPWCFPRLPPFPPLSKVRGQCPRHAPPFRRPCICNRNKVCICNILKYQLWFLSQNFSIFHPLTWHAVSSCQHQVTSMYSTLFTIRPQSSILILDTNYRLHQCFN